MNEELLKIIKGFFEEQSNFYQNYLDNVDDPFEAGKIGLEEQNRRWQALRQPHIGLINRTIEQAEALKLTDQNGKTDEKSQLLKCYFLHTLEEQKGELVRPNLDTRPSVIKAEPGLHWRNFRDEAFFNEKGEKMNYDKSIDDGMLILIGFPICNIDQVQRDIDEVKNLTPEEVRERLYDECLRGLADMPAVHDNTALVSVGVRLNKSLLGR